MLKDRAIRDRHERRQVRASGHIDNMPATRVRQTPAQSGREARARSRAAAGFLLRQFAAGAVCAAAQAVLSGGFADRRACRHLHRDRHLHPDRAAGARRRLRAHPAPAADAGDHRDCRRGVRRSHAHPAGRDVHQAQADHHLRAVRRSAARRTCLRQGAARAGVRFGVSSHRRRLAQAYAALGAVLSGACRSQ